jgi:hypothetical protein
VCFGQCVRVDGFVDEAADGFWELGLERRERGEQDIGDGEERLANGLDDRDDGLAGELDGRDAMFQGTTFEGKVVFWAHIDRDGDPITRGPGDLIGELRTTIPSTIKMTINKVL